MITLFFNLKIFYHSIFLDERFEIVWVSQLSQQGKWHMRCSKREQKNITEDETSLKYDCIESRRYRP